MTNSKDLLKEHNIPIPNDTPLTLTTLSILNRADRVETRPNGIKVVVTKKGDRVFYYDKNYILQTAKSPDEPNGIVSDVDKFVRLLLNVKGWTCCSVDADICKEIGQQIGETLSREIKYLPTTTYVCNNPVDMDYNIRNNGIIRYATRDDIPLILKQQKVDQEFSGFVPTELETYIEQNFVVIAVINDKIISISSVEELTNKYAMTMLYTDPRFRGKGFATDGKFLLLKQLLKLKKIPVTSIADDNEPSIKVNLKFGYKPYARESYFIIGKPPYGLNE